MLKELANSPKSNCILFSISTKVPVLIEVRNLDRSKRSQSEKPDFLNIWTTENERNVDWKKIAEDWIGKSN